MIVVASTSSMIIQILLLKSLAVPKGKMMYFSGEHEGFFWAEAGGDSRRREVGHLSNPS
jgi:hypothetical protein